MLNKNFEDMNKEELKDYAKIMADNVMDGETASIQFEDTVWDAYNSEDYENTVVFACEGTTYEYEFHTKEELESIIYDFFKELI